MDFIIKSIKKTNYTVISNSFLADRNISFAAKGLASYLLSKPSDWVINLQQIMNEFSIGRDAVKKYIGELIENHYMHKSRVTHFVKKGEQAIFYYISDSKEEICAKEKLESLSTETPELKTKNNEIETNIENTENIEKEREEEIEKEEKSIEEYTLEKHLDNFFNSSTKAIFLKIAPNMSVEEFDKLYGRCLKEKKQGYARSLEACIISAVQNKWIFRAKDKNLEESEKTERILKGNLRYYEDLYKDCGVNPQECIELFEKASLKFGEENMKRYRAILEERILRYKNIRN